MLHRRGFGLSAAAIVGLEAIVGSAHAQPQDIAAKLASYMSRMGVFGFGGQVVAVSGGQVLLDEAYGWADRRAGRRMRRSTPVGIASATKQFTAAAVMKLVEAGAVSLDAPIGTYLRDTPADKAPLTLHQLLSHTAGIQPGDLAEDFEAVSREDMLARVYASPLAGPPGEEWRYANAGYNLVAAVIEAASGRSYEDFLVASLFEPAGLSNTGFPFHRSLGRDVAHAYRGWVDQGDPSAWRRKNWRPWGGGTAFSTAADLYRWQQALESGRVLSPQSVARLVTPHARSSPEGEFNYAYGAFITHENGLLIERSGDWERGYNTAWHRWPEADLTLIVVSNSVTPGNISMRQAVQAELEQVLRGNALEAEPAEGAPLSRASRRRLERDGAAADGARVKLIDDGAYLWIAAQSQPAVELLLPGIPAERRAAYLVATQQTERLLSTMSRETYAAALRTEDPDLIDEFWNEWTGLLAEHGPLQRYDVLGSVRAGPAARTVARLVFEGRDRVMQLYWDELGVGRLVGTALTDIAPAPFGCVLAAGDGGLVGYDTLTGGRFVATQPTANHLKIGDTVIELET